MATQQLPPLPIEHRRAAARLELEALGVAFVALVRLAAARGLPAPNGLPLEVSSIDIAPSDASISSALEALPSLIERHLAASFVAASIDSNGLGA